MVESGRFEYSKKVHSKDKILKLYKNNKKINVLDRYTGKAWIRVYGTILF